MSGAYGLMRSFYIGKSRHNPSTQRANPTNQDVVKWIDKYGRISWTTLMVIPDQELHSEFGESYLINCFKKKLSQFKLLNMTIPHSMAMTYDKKSDSIISKLVNLII
jgi:hypothetical protein